MPMTFVLAVHGGAGSIPASKAEAMEAGVARALEAGAAVLRRRGSALDATMAAVRVLEDDQHFNAGRGAARTSAGHVELDAAVADGATRRAGAVAVITEIRHPIDAARAVLDDGRHVLLVGPAATEFARQHGLATEDPSWFLAGAGDEPTPGTVGAVALDEHGHLAAATSTGGTRGQQPGRIGDSPIIGAGTWADDDTCAISATGQGEAFILAAFAHEVDALLRLGGRDLATAADQALARVKARGGRGGCIAIDHTGAVAMPFTTPAMARGRIDQTGQAEVMV